MPSCLLGRATVHHLLEGISKRLQIAFEETDIPAHHPQVRNLLSFDPEVNRLNAYAQVGRSVTDRKREIIACLALPRRQLAVHNTMLLTFAHILF
jgi:hypothetical protein